MGAEAELTRLERPGGSGAVPAGGPGCSGPGWERAGLRAGCRGERDRVTAGKGAGGPGQVLAGPKDTRGVLSPVEEVLFLRVLSAAWYLSYEESKAKRGDVAWAEDFQSERQEAIEHASDKITSRCQHHCGRVSYHPEECAGRERKMTVVQENERERVCACLCCLCVCLHAQMACPHAGRERDMLND